ncbi:uncharacterized protein [Bemisia tabaci]
MSEEEMTRKLKTLRRQRGNVQGAITQFFKKLDGWKENPECRDSDFLEQSLESLQKTFLKFDGIQDDIEELDETEIEQREVFTDLFDKAVARARRYLRDAAKSPDNGTKSDSSTSTENESTSSISVKLPTIALPSYDGSLEGWASFFDLFTSLIDQNPKLTAVKKLYYLKTAMTGKAADLLTNFKTTDDNYRLALDLLKDKFNRPRRTLRQHYANLRDYPKLQKDTPTALGNLVDFFKVNLRAMKNLDAPIDQWSVPLIDLILTKIDEKTAYEWELKLTDDKMPSYEHLLAYLEKRANSIHLSGKPETSESNKSKSSNFRKDTSSNYPKRGALVVTNEKRHHCKCCNDGMHPLYSCPRFKTISVHERRDLAKRIGACFNCLKYRLGEEEGHLVTNCTKKDKKCRKCGSLHHTFLCSSASNSPTMKTTHSPSDSTGEQRREESSHASSSTPHVSLLTTDSEHSPGNNLDSVVLLGTALINVLGRDGVYYTLNAVVDSAASSSFISLAAAQKIGLKYFRTSEAVSGIGGGQAGVKGQTTCYVRPRHQDSPVLPTDTVVIKKIVNLPKSFIPKNVRAHFSDLPLADPHFGTAREVEFLIGADIFPLIFTGEKKFGPSGTLTALNSVFGYIIMGKIDNHGNQFPGHVALIAAPSNGSSTDALLRKFWEIEEIPKPVPSHPDDVIAERIFKNNHYRLGTGRYVVPLLIRNDASPLGDSKSLALQRLNGTERRFNKQPELKEKYSEFLKEYESLGHMGLVNSENFGLARYYIPHHAVFREDSATTKVRVVFDGSQRSSSGIALNEILYSGPKLQKDVFDVIARFRIHQKVFTCDISKMYRQILLRPDERKYQHIFWRHDGELKEFELNTVTYGLSSSPFLALRVIKQLTEDEGHKYPAAATALCRDMFVDDLATGAPDTQRLLELQHQTIGLLKEGCFETQKWASNCPEILLEVPPEHRTTSLDLTDECAANSKILGIHWNAQSDYFYYVAKTGPHEMTKRNILSQVARIFDSNGLISPIVFKAKTIIQKLWIEGLDWDDQLPDELELEWTKFYEKLPSISLLKIDRCATAPNATSHSLVGFSDASQLGYAAAVYVRSEAENAVKVSLLASKSRIAPCKTISIPRLELCGAQLLSTLLIHLKEQLSDVMEIHNIVAFTDSQVVLDWIKTLPCKLKTFEANRVTYILERLEPSTWNIFSRVQKITQQFWKIWSRDYLHTLIQRTKWQQRQEDLKIGAVVLMADNDTAPTHWKKGIIDAVHPGKDGVVRVVTVRTARGTYKRPAVKIYPLPSH